MFGTAWLNCEIVNFIFKLLTIKSHIYAAYYKRNRPDFFISTYFTSKLFGTYLTKFDVAAVECFGNRNPFCQLFNSYRKLFFPINHSNLHWTLVEVNLEAKTITHFDSLPRVNGSAFINKNSHPVTKIFKYLLRLAVKQKEERFLQTTKEWKFYYETNEEDKSRIMDPNIEYTWQGNGYDCGLYMVVTAEILHYQETFRHHLNLRTYLNQKK